jgi:hypothetical protein
MEWPIDVFREYANRARSMEVVRFQLDAKEIARQRVEEAGRIMMQRRRLAKLGVPVILT